MLLWNNVKRNAIVRYFGLVLLGCIAFGLFSLLVLYAPPDSFTVSVLKELLVFATFVCCVAGAIGCLVETTKHLIQTTRDEWKRLREPLED